MAGGAGGGRAEGGRAEGGRAGGCGTGLSLTEGNLPTDFTHRIDGTPLGFSSRDAKAEQIRQRSIEERYEAEQSAWGLTLPPAATRAVGRDGLALAGHGKQAVRPAWLTRQERKLPIQSPPMQAVGGGEGGSGQGRGSERCPW